MSDSVFDLRASVATHRDQIKRLEDRIRSLEDANCKLKADVIVNDMQSQTIVKHLSDLIKRVGEQNVKK